MLIHTDEEELVMADRLEVGGERRVVSARPLEHGLAPAQSAIALL
jgi:hypothetical protein